MTHALFPVVALCWVYAHVLEMGLQAVQLPVSDTYPLADPLGKRSRVGPAHGEPLCAPPSSATWNGIDDGDTLIHSVPGPDHLEMDEVPNRSATPSCGKRAVDDGEVFREVDLAGVQVGTAHRGAGCSGIFKVRPKDANLRSFASRCFSHAVTRRWPRWPPSSQPRLRGR